ncbi:MAG: hypothetical protein ACJ0BR_07115 [Candidatus Puniceispirillales bacterium]
MRQPSKVMKLQRLGSFHQSRLSFTRQLINELQFNNSQFEISEWNIDQNGFGNAVIQTVFNNNTFSLVVFCHSIDDEERSDRVIAEKWDMTFSLFTGTPTKTELDLMSKNLKIQELGRHLPKQLTLSRANKSVRIFTKVLDALSNGKQPYKADINDIGYLIRTTAVYGNGKFGIGDFSPNTDKSVLNKPFQAEMLTVYLIRYFSIELVNFLAEKKGENKSVKMSDDIARHLGVGNATGLGMAPFLINHQELIHQWINTRETAISRVLSIKSINKNTQKQIITYIEQAYRYTSQWNVDDVIQTKRIKTLNLDLKNILNCKQLNNLLNKNYPIKSLSDYFINKISLETEEILYSIFIEPFPQLIDDLTKQMGSKEKKSVFVGYNVKEIIQIIRENYKWALNIDISSSDENYFFWYTSQAKLEPRLGVTLKDDGYQKQLPFDISHQVQKALKILMKLPENMTGSEAMINHPEIRNIIRRVIINKTSPYSEIQDNLVGRDMRPIDILRCKLSFFGASKYDPKSDLWTRITLFQGAPLPHQLQDENACDWLFPYLSDA